MSAHELPKALVCAHEYPGALMSMVLWCHECSWVLMSAHSLVAPCSQLLLCSDECSLLHGTKLMSAHGCSWVFNGNQEHSWLLMAAYECSWGLLGIHECSLAALMRSHELGVMEQCALMRAQEQSWAGCHGATGTHQNSWALMAPDQNTYECCWLLIGHISAYQSSWALMRAHECWTASLNKKTKMLTFKMISLSYFANLSTHISPTNKKMDIFKI